MTATVPPDLLDRAHERARLEDRSLASVVRRALVAYLDNEGSERDGDHAPRDGVMA